MHLVRLAQSLHEHWFPIGLAHNNLLFHRPFLSDCKHPMQITCSLEQRSCIYMSVCESGCARYCANKHSTAEPAFCCNLNQTRRVARSSSRIKFVQSVHMSTHSIHTRYVKYNALSVQRLHRLFRVWSLLSSPSSAHCACAFFAIPYHSSEQVRHLSPPQAAGSYARSTVALEYHVETPGRRTSPCVESIAERLVGS
jgi:hypothetical protein